MAGETDKSEEEKGFVIKDKRFSAKKEPEQPGSPPPQEKQEEPHPKEQARAKAGAEQPGPPPEISFTGLIFSLSTSALIQLGEIQDPVSKESSKDLPAAKQTIDLISMLKEKTKGNLSSDEEKFMENILYDLKMRYVKEMG
jgi:hypothetical protein